MCDDTPEQLRLLVSRVLLQLPDDGGRHLSADDDGGRQSVVFKRQLKDGKACREYLKGLFDERVGILDGAMGTRLQRETLTENAYRANQVQTYLANKRPDHNAKLKGNHDLLSLSLPELVYTIHLEYIKAGADFIETNTFNSNAISQSDYQLSELAPKMSFVSAQIARAASNANTNRITIVAGSIGPTNVTLSLSPNVSDPSYRKLNFDDLYGAYKEQIRELFNGGVDIYLVETCFDTMNAKAAIAAYLDYFECEVQDINGDIRPPLAVSGTIIDMSGRTLSGQTIEAFYSSIKHAHPFIIGLNCSLGGTQMKPFFRRLNQICPDTYLSCYPNAGLPNAMGGYDEGPETFANILRTYVDEGLVNLVGGCCGTDPRYITELKATLTTNKPNSVRTLKQQPEGSDRRDPLFLSGLECLKITPDVGFVNIGERCNVAGFAKFKRLIQNNQFNAALEIARDQVQSGAMALDINFDDALLDGRKCMSIFCRLIASDPEISKVPLVIDSSNFDIIVEGLKWSQGSCIVNSLSLKDGDETLRKRVRIARSLGAATIFMAFDEMGQAATVERKVQICKRAYDLLTKKRDGSPPICRPADLIFDVNILTIATGLEEHNNYARDFIEAIKLLRHECPGSRFSGGVSNLSFSFRGLQKFREEIHSVFLYYAIQAGLDMAIVNAGNLPPYELIDPGRRETIRRVIFNSVIHEEKVKPGDPESMRDVEGLLGMAQKEKTDIDNAKLAGGQGDREKDVRRVEEWRHLPIKERLCEDLVRGVDLFIEEDAAEALALVGSALTVIEDLLMGGMGRVGEMFATGKMFLPQVIKSARVMKKAVAFLEPHLIGEKKGDPKKLSSQVLGTIILATVKGDVHDIGKNLVGVVLGCNRFHVIDLGVMVPCEKIIEAAKNHSADMIGLSGLITPSLDEMRNVCKAMNDAKMKIPILIGGATTSKIHTAIKLVPEYSGPVVHVSDASRAVVVAQSLMGSNREIFLERLEESYDEARMDYEDQLKDRCIVPFEEAKLKPTGLKLKVQNKPNFVGVQHWMDVPISTIRDFIDWLHFFPVYQLRGKYPNRDYPEIFKDPTVGQQARNLMDEAQSMLDELETRQTVKLLASVAILPARRNGDGDIEVKWFRTKSLKDESFVDPKRGPVRSYRLLLEETETCTLLSLREQEILVNDEPKKRFFRSIGDFIATQDDYIGMFGVTAGYGTKALIEEYERRGEIDKKILCEAIQDRLAEALAEYVHLCIRRELWGFCPNEQKTLAELLRAEFQGIRPAPGYPCQPDGREKAKLMRMLRADEIFMQLEETSFMIIPEASVCALVFSHPDSEYFSVGHLGKDQIQSYSYRKLKLDLNREPTSDEVHKEISATESWMRQYLAYTV